MNNKLEYLAKYQTLFEKYKNLLTQNQLQVFELYFYKDLSYGEIAEIIATTRTAVYDTVKKTLKKLDLLNSKINL